MEYMGFASQDFVGAGVVKVTVGRCFKQPGYWLLTFPQVVEIVFEFFDFIGQIWLFRHNLSGTLEYWNLGSIIPGFGLKPSVLLPMSV